MQPTHRARQLVGHQSVRHHAQFRPAAGCAHRRAGKVTRGLREGILAHHDGVIGYDRTDHVAIVRMDSADRIPDLVHALSLGGARVTRVEPHEPTLEDLYFAVRQSSGDSRLGAVDGSTV